MMALKVKLDYISELSCQPEWTLNVKENIHTYKENSESQCWEIEWTFSIADAVKYYKYI